MKRWRKASEWFQLANCYGSAVHTGENLTDDELSEAAAVCGECPVRVECIQWALREKACAVVVAGVYLPDPGNKKELRQVYADLQEVLPDEVQARGEDF